MQAEHTGSAHTPTHTHLTQQDTLSEGTHLPEARLPDSEGTRMPTPTCTSNN